MLIQLIGLVGASLVLLAHWMISSGRFAPASSAAIGVNIMGSVTLLAVAFETMQIGYIILNAAWFFISARMYLRRGEIAWEHRAK
jgi:hypothetical protein